MILLVWHENQRIPASVYGNAHYGVGNFTIRVCSDPNQTLKMLGRDKALIYHFNSNGGGSGGRGR